MLLRYRTGRGMQENNAIGHNSTTHMLLRATYCQLGASSCDEATISQCDLVDKHHSFLRRDLAFEEYFAYKDKIGLV